MRRASVLVPITLALTIAAARTWAGPTGTRPSFAAVYQASVRAAVAQRLSALFRRVRDTERSLMARSEEDVSTTVDRWENLERPALLDLLQLVQFARRHDARIDRWASRRLRPATIERSAHPAPAGDPRPGAWPASWYGPLRAGELDLASVQRGLGVVPPAWDRNAMLFEPFTRWSDAEREHPVLASLGLDASRSSSAPADAKLAAYIYMYRAFSRGTEQDTLFRAIAASDPELVPPETAPGARAARLRGFLASRIDLNLLELLERRSDGPEASVLHRGRLRFGVLRTRDLPRLPAGPLAAEMLDRAFFVRDAALARPRRFEEYYHRVKLPAFATVCAELERAASRGRAWGPHATLARVVGRAFPPASPFVCAPEARGGRFEFVRSPASGRVTRVGLAGGPLAGCAAVYRAIARSRQETQRATDALGAALGGVLLLQMRDVHPAAEELAVPAAGFQGYVDVVDSLVGEVTH
jgi:hypothetical protein